MKLREEIAIVIVTHNLQQAYRVADRVAFMYLGDLVEYRRRRSRCSTRRRRSAPASTSAGGSVEPLALIATASLGVVVSLGLVACQTTQETSKLREAGRGRAREGRSVQARIARTRTLKVVGAARAHRRVRDRGRGRAPEHRQGGAGGRSRS